MCPFAVPTSENEPRVPAIRPNEAGLFRLKDDSGLLNWGFLNGKLFASRRIWKRARSPMLQYFVRDSWVQFRPGPRNVFRPRLPTVNAAGYANELKFAYGFCAEVGKRLAPMSQS